MTSTETQVTDPLVINPGIADALRRLPEGYRFALWNSENGAMRAYESNVGTDDCYFMRIAPTPETSTGSYVGREWTRSRYLGGSFAFLSTQDPPRWFPARLPEGVAPQLPFPVNQSILDAVARVPAGYTVVFMDSRDGELRAFGNEVDNCYSMHIYPARNGADGRTLDFTGREWSERNYENARNYDRNTWVRVPSPLLLPDPDVEEPHEAVDPQMVVIADLQAENTRLARENNRLGQRITDLEAEAEAYKERVARVGTRYAKAHGWCSVVDEALSELDVERIHTKFSATMTVTVRFTAERCDGEYGTPSSRSVYEWLGGEEDIESSIRDNMSFDSDYVDEDNVEIHDISFNITGVAELAD